MAKPASDPCGVAISRHPISQSRIMWGQGALYPSMERAVEALDPFNGETYWPLRNVVPYLGRMGVE